jgi:hypothetical protein
MKSLFRKILLGDTEIKEYATVTIAGDIKESVFLKAGQFTIDISKIHWVLCLEPIVFGVWLTKGAHAMPLDSNTRCSVYFSDSTGNDFKIAKRNAVAIIALEYFDKIEEADGTLYLLKLCKSSLYHVNFLKTFLLFHKYYKKPNLSFERYKSLVAAYSYPRRVRIISFKQDDYFNIFPMDLLGEIPQSDRYVFGLRHTNVALAKIIEAKRIVASEVPYIYKDIIYELGKHHSGHPPSQVSLPFKIQQTENFGFPVPEWADSYKEIQILRTKGLGSHMLLWGKIVNGKTLKQSPGNLYHIHFLLYYHQKLKRSGYTLV